MGGKRILDIKVCKLCKESFEQRTDEKRESYRRRRTCSKACAKELSVRGARLQQSHRPLFRECEVCGESFKRRDREKGFNKRKTCSRGCAVELQRQGGAKAGARNKKPHPAKKCPSCGKLFGKDLAPSILKTRPTCSKECTTERRRKLPSRARPCDQCKGPRPKGSTRKLCEECAEARKSTLPKSKACAICGGEFAKKKGCSERDWAAQRYCSRDCVSARAGTLADVKECNNCGKQFPRKPDQRRSIFRKQRGCSASCSRELTTNARRVSDADRVCVVCSAPFSVRPSDKRVTCSHKCKYQIHAVKVPASRPCARCGEAMTRRAGEPKANYMGRKYCTKCRRAPGKKPEIVTKACEACGNEFSREDAYAPRRKYCSPKCRADGSAIVTTVDVLGVALSIADIAELTGRSVRIIRWRIKHGRNLLTGKRTKDAT